MTFASSAFARAILSRLPKNSRCAAPMVVMTAAAVAVVFLLLFGGLAGHQLEDGQGGVVPEDGRRRGREALKRRSQDDRPPREH